ncbi:Transcriptional regulator [Mesorhizobium sp. ORS 3324]|nr:Transcriptional regulator [Mesorhizobium sp. ORS 3324]
MNRRDGSLQKLMQLLASGRYPAQSRLPPERELAQMLGVSRSGLREGLEMLEAEERIWRHVGRGTFVGPRPLGAVSGIEFVSAATSPEEVLEVRLLIEPLIARHAARRATSTEIENMWRLLEKSEVAHDAKAWELWDGTLHRAVAQAAHNKLLLALFDAFNAIRGQAAWGLLRQAALSRQRLIIYRQQHRAYVEAIAARDPLLAEQAMRDHIKTVCSNLLGWERDQSSASDVGRERTKRSTRDPAPKSGSAKKPRAGRTDGP